MENRRVVYINKKLISKQYPDVDKQKLSNWYAFRPFTSEELDEIQKLKQNLIFKTATISGKGKIDNSYRETRTGWIPDNDSTNWIYDRVLDCVITANEKLSTVFALSFLPRDDLAFSLTIRVPLLKNVAFGPVP